MIPPHIPIYPAPAKLNLDLRIIGRRQDGYHLLESIFILIDWYDHIGITSRQDGNIILHTPLPDIPAEHDLTVRAAHALKPYRPHANNGVNIWINKQIPTGGGLGGGSSNAATVLMALNQIWQCGLTSKELTSIGLTLGADVPFFLYGRSAFVRGIGEQMQAINIPQQYYVVVYPNCHVSTANIFNAPDLPRNSTPNTYIDFASLHPLRNDMQETVLSQYPEVATAHQILSQYGHAQMTGSGSCIFLPIPDLDTGQSLCMNLPKQWQSRCTTMLPQHPIQKILHK